MEESKMEEPTEKNDESNQVYDLIIIGGGPAGYSAAIYAGRYNLKAVVLTKELGVISEAPEVENYPGIESISGFELMQRFQKHAQKVGVETKFVEVADVRRGITLFSVTDSDGNIYKGHTILIATGTEKRKLEAENAEKYEGRGISYCATCDAAFYKDKRVAVVGGSDSAAKYALLLASFASKVYIIYRGENLRAEQMLVDKVKSNPKIEILTKELISKIEGEKRVERITLSSGRQIEIDGIFVAMGGIPSSALAKKLGVEVDPSGYIIVNNETQATNIPGVYAAGDVTKFPLKQIITAAAQGAVAAHSVNDFIKERR
ncbi:MAG: FAD-dependent oxidoreductase [Candidatus Micrarchaeia archaeon]